MNVAIILAFFATKKTKTNGKTTSFTHIRKYHDAILFGAEKVKERLPTSYFDEMEKFLKGFKKECATAKSAGNLDEREATPFHAPYRSGLPIDSLFSETPREDLRLKYCSYLGMLNWLSISTRPDLTTVHSLLASATESPSHAHLEALRHVGRYVKATLDYGISFSSRSNPSLEAFIQFPLDDTDEASPHPTAFADASWGPQDASTPSPVTLRPITIEETRSICGHLVFLSHGPLIWKSHKEKRNSQSKWEAEVKATDECTKSVQWLRNVLSDLSLLSDQQI